MSPAGELAMGDVCQAVPMSVLADDRVEEVLVTDAEPAVAFVPARFSFALALGVLNGYAILASIGTASGIPDAREFARLVERGRTARSYARLPAISNDEHEVWKGEAGVAFFSHVESFPADETLTDLRVASMNDASRDILRARLARVLGGP
jgi:hypothetical protein